MQGVEGPSSVYVNVICDRKRTADPVRIHPNYYITFPERDKYVFRYMCSIKFKHSFVRNCLVVYTMTVNNSGTWFNIFISLSSTYSVT